MRKAAAATVVLIAVGLMPSHRPTAAAVAPSKEQFLCKLVITGPESGGPKTIAHPTLAVIDGQQSSFVAGGEVQVDLGTSSDEVPYGVEVRLKVHRISDDKLRVDLYAGNGILDAKGGSNVTVHEYGTRVVREVASDATFAFDLDRGGQVTARVASISPAK